MNTNANIDDDADDDEGSYEDDDVDSKPGEDRGVTTASNGGDAWQVCDTLDFDREHNVSTIRVM